eukprot:scaffold8275_cov61-Phaeocystis_antarctica.AAC.10
MPLVIAAKSARAVWCQCCSVTRHHALEPALVRRAAHRGRLPAVHAHDGAQRLGSRLRAVRPPAGAAHGRKRARCGRPARPKTG